MNDQRIFIGIYPAGIVYADRTVEVDGDYARLAFLPYSTLELEFSRTCPAELKQEIRDSAITCNEMNGLLELLNMAVRSKIDRWISAIRVMK